MRSRLHKWDRSRSGALATELAIVLPFMVFALLVVVDFCRLYHLTQTLTASAHVGAYYASGAAEPPAYRPPTGGLLPGVTELGRTILGGQPVDPVQQRTMNRETAARKAAIAECSSLQPALREDQVTFRYVNNNAEVTVSYSTELITPIFGGSRTVQLARIVTMPMVGP
jgi:hypothetical protein